MPGKLIPGEEKTPVYKKSGPFKLRSGNTTPFKQMGSSPLKQTEAIEHWKKYQKAKKPGTISAVSKDITRVAKGGKPKVEKIVAKKAAKRGIVKTLLKGAGKIASRFLGPVGAAVAAYDVVTTAPKVAKATRKSLKKQAKTGQTVGFPKY